MPFTLPTLIEANHLQNASNDPDFALRFPRLIEVLVRASLPQPPEKIRFPAFGTGQAHGFDGSLTSVGAPPFVPKGKVIFEFKTSSTPRSDAEDDYEKRKKQISPDEAQELTFVFVTNRSWPGKGEDVTEWEETKRNEGHFKDVKVIDVSVLVSWLRSHPSAAWFAAQEILRFHPIGFSADTLDRYLETFVGDFNPPLPRAVLLAGREKLANRVKDEGFAIGGAEYLFADMEEEVAAFSCAALLATGDSDLLEERRSKSLVVSDLLSANLLETAAGLTLILMGEATKAAARLRQKNAVVVAHAFGDRATDSPIYLERPTQQAFADALASEGLPTGEAWDLAARCGRLLCVLRRQRGGATAVPDWAEPGVEDAPATLAALLASSWWEAHEDDTHAVSQLANEPYTTIRRRLLRLLEKKDALLTYVDRAWTVRAPIDAISRLAKHITSDELELFRSLAKSVFESYRDAPDPSEVYQPDRPKGHSSRLRTSVAQNILILSAIGDKLGIFQTAQDCRTFIADIVSAMPNLRSHPGFLLAFERELPYLAEASPESFFEALNPLFEGDDEQVKWLLSTGERSFLFSHNRYHGVVWAITRLAWSPKYFQQAALILAKLAQSDPRPEGASGPRPIETLAELFNIWAPQSAAGLDIRRVALNEILRTVPGASAGLIRDLLPGQTTSVATSTKPVFLEVPQLKVTYGDLWAFEEEIVTIALRLVEVDHTLLTDILTSLPRMHKRSFERSIVALRSLLPTLPEEERNRAWKMLRQEVARHTKFKDADWALPDDALGQLSGLLQLIAPRSAVQLEYLFDDEDPDLGISDWKQAFAELKNRRLNVIEPLLAAGAEQVVALALRVKAPHLVVQTLSEIQPDIDTCSALLSAARAVSDSNLIGMLARLGYEQYRETWLGKLLPEFQDALNHLFPDDDLVDFVRTLDDGVKQTFWLRCPVHFGMLSKSLNEVVALMSEAGRSADVVFNHSFKPKLVEPHLLLKVASAALAEVLPDKETAKRFDKYLFERVLTALDESGIDDLEIARLEWPITSVLYLDKRRTMALRRVVLRDAELLLEVVSKAYVAEGKTRQKLSEDEEALATASSKVLFGLWSSPFFGTESVDTVGLKRWIDDAIRLASEQGYLPVVRSLVGQVLAHAPQEPADGRWPHIAVRELLEDLCDPALERAVEIERFNMRGVHSDSISFYQRHAEQGFADAAAMTQWQRTRDMLIRIAESDQQWSDRHRVDRKREQENNQL